MISLHYVIYEQYQDGGFATARRGVANLMVRYSN